MLTKELPVVHIVNLKGFLLHPKEDASRVARGWNLVPGKLLPTYSLKLMKEKVFFGRLLQPNDIYILLTHVFLQLALATWGAKPLKVLDQ
jgi:hypothetical protein